MPHKANEFLQWQLVHWGLHPTPCSTYEPEKSIAQLQTLLALNYKVIRSNFEMLTVGFHGMANQTRVSELIRKRVCLWRLL